MAGETTSTSTTHAVNSEVIDQMIIDYLIDANVMMPLVSYRNIAGAKTKVVAFARRVKDSGSDITEGTGLSSTSTEMTMGNATVTVGVVGIAREITDLAQAVTIGDQMAYAVEDGAALCKEMAEDDLCGLLDELTGTTIGSTGVDLSLANFIEAIARMRTAKARGKYVALLDDQQALDLTQSVASATGSVWSNQANADQSVLNSRSDGFVGSLLGVDIWYSNLTDTANTGADVCGGIWLDPAVNDGQCAFALVELWQPKVTSRPDVLQPSTEMSVTYAYGVGTKLAAAGCPIITDA
jgi:hypothetical protein